MHHVVVVRCVLLRDRVAEQVCTVERHDAIKRVPQLPLPHEHSVVQYTRPQELRPACLLLLALAHQLGEQAHLLEVLTQPVQELELPQLELARALVNKVADGPRLNVQPLEQWRTPCALPLEAPVAHDLRDGLRLAPQCNPRQVVVYPAHDIVGDRERAGRVQPVVGPSALGR